MLVRPRQALRSSAHGARGGAGVLSSGGVAGGAVVVMVPH